MSVEYTVKKTLDTLDTKSLSPRQRRILSAVGAFQQHGPSHRLPGVCSIGEAVAESWESWLGGRKKTSRGQVERENGVLCPENSKRN